VLLVGCEPASIDEQIGLSEPVAAAVDEAVRIVLDLVRDAGADDNAGSVAVEGRPANARSQLPQQDSKPAEGESLPAEADRQPAAGNSRR
jgi:hypothetical protein